MKRILLPLLLALCLLLTGCGGSTQAAAYTDDAIMARKGDWYTMNDWQHSLSDNTLNCSMKGSTGTLTVWSMDAKADTPVSIDCTLAVTAGRAKLAHIAPDGTVSMGGCKMPKKYVAEMFCDRIAACRVYQGDKYTDASAYDYFHRTKGRLWINEETAALLDRWLLLLKEEGEETAFRQIRRELRACKTY